MMTMMMMMIKKQHPIAHKYTRQQGTQVKEGILKTSNPLKTKRICVI
jgi:hypothetical protein